MQKTGTLFSIGYGNKSHTEVFSWLKENNIQILVDVRSKPYSRFRPEFNRNRLAVSLPALGVEYQFRGKESGGLLTHDKADQDISCIHGA